MRTTPLNPCCTVSTAERLSGLRRYVTDMIALQERIIASQSCWRG